MQILGHKTSSRSRKKKRRNYSSNAPRCSVNVHITTGGTQRYRKRK